MRQKERELRRHRKRRKESLKARRRAAMAGKPIAMPKSPRKVEATPPAAPVEAAVAVETAVPVETAAAIAPAASEPEPPIA